MTSSSENNLNPHVPPTFLAGLIVLLLLGIAVLNLPLFTSIPSKAYITASQKIIVRSGPSTFFIPPIGRLTQNQQADLLAHSPDGAWFKIKYDNGSGWVFAADVKPSIDPSQIPVDDGPPLPTLTPTPVTPTPTVTPITSMTPSPPTNLVLGNIRLSDPLPLVCGKTVEISVDVANLGNEATTSSGSISIRDVVSSTGQEVGSTSGAFGPIQNGQTVNVNGIFLVVTSPVGEEHKLIVTINADGKIPETSSTDNTREFTYTLQGCG